MHIYTPTPLKVAVLLMAVAALGACATQPGTYVADNSRTFSKPYDAVWEDVVGYFARNNIQVKTIAKDSGVIYAEASSFDDRAADCGGRGMFRAMGRRANFNVFVSRTGKDSKVSVNTEYLEARRIFDAASTFQCTSTGVLEQAILNAITP